MKIVLACLVCACVIVAAPASAAAQAAPAAQAAQADQTAKLVEAHAIIETMFPPAERQHMFDKLLTELSAQFSAALPADLAKEPGIKAIMDDFMARSHTRQLAVLQTHMPAMFDAMALAYTHEFSLAELKDIHGFAATPSGRHYLSRSAALIGDPAVAKVNTQLIADAQAVSAEMAPELKDKLVAYVNAHPDVAARIAAEDKKP